MAKWRLWHVDIGFFSTVRAGGGIVLKARTVPVVEHKCRYNSCGHLDEDC